MRARRIDGGHQQDSARGAAPLQPRATLSAAREPLEAEIGRGGLKPGDRLESEARLTARFQVSRITLRQAVAELVRKQLLVRKQGKGTFVTAPAVRHDLKRSLGLRGSLFAQAHGASARLLRYELRVPPAEIMALLNTAANQPALALDRLYLIGGSRWPWHRLGSLPRSPSCRAPPPSSCPPKT